MNFSPSLFIFINAGLQKFPLTPRMQYLENIVEPFIDRNLWPRPPKSSTIAEVRKDKLIERGFGQLCGNSLVFMRYWWRSVGHVGNPDVCKGYSEIQQFIQVSLYAPGKNFMLTLGFNLS